MLPSTAAASAAGVPLAFPAQLFAGGVLQYALLFLVLAVVAGVVGARGVAGISMGIARILVVVFLVLAVASLLL